MHPGSTANSLSNANCPSHDADSENPTVLLS